LTSQKSKVYYLKTKIHGVQMNKLKLSVSCLISLLCCALFAANEQDVIASVEYFYAQDGTLIGRAVNGIRQNFEYDKRGQILAVKDANGRDLERYTYDPAGNRLSKTVNGITTTYTYDEANQLKTSTVNGETTHYRYDAAGRLVQAGDKTYYYFGANDRVTEVRRGDKVIAEFDYFMDGQIASAKYPDREESFTWDGLALVQRNEVSYLNEPYVTGGNPILSSRNGVMFNDMLGSTLNIGGQSVAMTSFGETEGPSAFFTGKPMIPELGYSFLFRDYNPAQGKWTSSDPLGYPDGWNNFAYCNNDVINFVDCSGCDASSRSSDESAYISFVTQSGIKHSSYVNTVDDITYAILHVTKYGNDKIVQFTYTGHGFTDGPGLRVNLKTKREDIEPWDLAKPPEDVISDMENGRASPSIGFAIYKSFREGVDIRLNACCQGNYLQEYLDYIYPVATIHGFRGVVSNVGPISWEFVFENPFNCFTGMLRTLTEGVIE